MTTIQNSYNTFRASVTAFNEASEALGLTLVKALKPEDLKSVKSAIKKGALLQIKIANLEDCQPFEVVLSKDGKK